MTCLRHVWAIRVFVEVSALESCSLPKRNERRQDQAEGCEEAKRTGSTRQLRTAFQRRIGKCSSFERRQGNVPRIPRSLAASAIPIRIHCPRPLRSHRRSPPRVRQRYGPRHLSKGVWSGHRCGGIQPRSRPLVFQPERRRPRPSRSARRSMVFDLTDGVSPGTGTSPVCTGVTSLSCKGAGTSPYVQAIRPAAQEGCCHSRGGWGQLIALTFNVKRYTRPARFEASATGIRACCSKPAGRGVLRPSPMSRCESWRNWMRLRRSNSCARRPGNRLESLRGDRTGQYSIRVNDQFRICFRWTKLGPTQVEIVDYH